MSATTTSETWQVMTAEILIIRHIGDKSELERLCQKDDHVLPVNRRTTAAHLAGHVTPIGDVETRIRQYGLTAPQIPRIRDARVQMRSKVLLLLPNESRLRLHHLRLCSTMDLRLSYIGHRHTSIRASTPRSVVCTKCLSRITSCRPAMRPRISSNVATELRPHLRMRGRHLNEL